MAGQGCPNEGPDKRIFGKLTCFLQRLLTWSSTYEPVSVLVAFPPSAFFSWRAWVWAGFIGSLIYFLGASPWWLLTLLYVAINFPVPFSALTKLGVHKNIHIRFGGWRYDFNAKIYITPEAAIKDTSRAVFY